MRQGELTIIDDLFVRYPSMEDCREDVTDAAEALIECFRGKGKLLVCGNGGSAADSDHIVGELMKGFALPRRLPQEIQERFYEAFPDEADGLIHNLQSALPALSLSAHTALLTAFGNDVSPEYAFAQQVLGYGRAGDVLLAISTSGNSSNILHAARAAKIQGIKVIGLTGQIGGELKKLSDIAICVPEREPYRIQELHLPVYHCLCLCAERGIFADY